MSFVHLHLHTEYSLLDGFARIDRLFEAVKSKGMDSVAITDHGVMFGAVEFYKQALAHGIKPIIGCEVYLAARTLKDKDPLLDKRASHLILLAENDLGYHNLIKLVSIAYTKGFYYKPRVDHDVLRAHSEGLIALSSCLAGEIPAALLDGNHAEARRRIEQYLSIFDREHFYLELQDHGLAQQKKVNQGLIQLAKDYQVELVASNDVHYIDREDAKIHDVLLAIQTGKTLADSERLRFDNDQFYLKSAEEMAALFPNQPEALANTVKIAQRCQFDFDFNARHLPTFKVPTQTSAADYLRQLCEQTLFKKYPKETARARRRLQAELAIIIEMGYEDYFLIVWDFVKFARDRGILVGPCRGSGGGSITAYLLSITDVDPLRYQLIFERFLNPERITMPDFDIDFQDDRRAEVIDYVIEKYGSDHVAQIITFGTLGARAAIRDVGRVLDMPYRDVDHVAKEIPLSLGITLQQALVENKTLAARYQSEPEIKQLIDIAMAIEGMPRHASTHAAGVVISALPVDQHVPLYLQDGNITTQYNMVLLEEIGLLKMDFLGLRTLTVIDRAAELVRATYKIDFDPQTIPFDDSEVFKLIGSGYTMGVFQLESAVMIRFMRALKPTSIEDIIAGISLYRPGPMDSIPKYIENKNNPAKISYLHPTLKDILEVTYGCLVYQEQVMQIVRKLAGYSYGRSDLVRRAMSKKKMDVMQRERERFVHGLVDDAGRVLIEGCLRRGISEDTANTIFDDMIDFAKYAFNKSHAAGYAIIAYQTAYIKVKYPKAFLAACMTSNIHSLTKIAQYISECQRLNIAVLPPDVTRSEREFSVEAEGIRFGLLAIKNVGKGLIDSLLAQRQRAPFKSFEDVLMRIERRELSKKPIESLIKAGAFDCFDKTRAVLLINFEQLIDAIHSQRRNNVEGQFSLMDHLSEDSEQLHFQFRRRAPFDATIKLNFEKEVLGIYLSGHPLDKYATAIQKIQTMRSIDLYNEEGQPNQALDHRSARLSGIIAKVVEKGTRSGQTMAFITLEDLHGSLEVIIFSRVYQKYCQYIKSDNIIAVSGKVTVREDDEPKVIAEDIYPLKESFLNQSDDKSAVRCAYLRCSRLDESKMAFLSKWAEHFPGTDRVIIYQTEDKTSLDFKRRASLSSASLNVLRRCFGAENIVVK